MRVRKFPLLVRLGELVAYGVDPVSGERWLLDWEQGQKEDEASWRKLLERLLDRGLRAERGLELFIHDGSAGLEKAFELVYFGPGVDRQRCIFHKLRNVGREVVGEKGMSRKERQECRGEVVADAAEVYRCKGEDEIRRRLVRLGGLAAFRAKWGEKEPKAVVTFERDFDRTLVYLKVQERARLRGQEYRLGCLRATSSLERVQRHFRQKARSPRRARQVVVFHSAEGIAAAVQLVISHHHLADDSTQPWTRLLEEAILAA